MDGDEILLGRLTLNGYRFVEKILPLLCGQPKVATVANLD